MKERPILLSAPMVNAILRGGKTQTRRIIRPQPYIDSMGNACWNGRNFGQDSHGKPHIDILASSIPCSRTKRVFCPFGKTGDRLWVRETFADLTKDFGHKWERKNPNTGFYERGRHPFFWYRADGDIPDPFGSPIDAPWKPSIHMPRHASRITLEVIGVRVEALQAISEADALAEGIQIGRDGHYNGAPHQIKGTPKAFNTAKEAFADLWVSIYGAESWNSNPFVWVVEFDVIKKRNEEGEPA